VVFVIFCLFPEFASRFSGQPSGFVRRGRCFEAIVGCKAIFLLDRNDSVGKDAPAQQILVQDEE